MFVVYFFEKKNLLLSQLRKRVPSVGDLLTIKGRKGKVFSVTRNEEEKFNVQVIFEVVKKNNLIVENSKKKKR